MEPKWLHALILCVDVTGIPSTIQAAQSNSAPVQKGVRLHEDDTSAQIPGGLCTGEGH